MVNGNDICFPRQNCHGNVLPHFIVNDTLFIPSGTNDSIIIGVDNICFKNVTETLHYIERCHESFNCTGLGPGFSSINEELVISLRIHIKTTTGIRYRN